MTLAYDQLRASTPLLNQTITNYYIYEYWQPCSMSFSSLPFLSSSSFFPRCVLSSLSSFRNKCRFRPVVKCSRTFKRRRRWRRERERGGKGLILVLLAKEGKKNSLFCGSQVRDSGQIATFTGRALEGKQAPNLAPLLRSLMEFAEMTVLPLSPTSCSVPIAHSFMCFSLPFSGARASWAC